MTFHDKNEAEESQKKLGDLCSQITIKIARSKSKNEWRDKNKAPPAYDQNNTVGEKLIVRRRKSYF